VTGTTDHPSIVYLIANIWNLKMYATAVFEKKKKSKTPHA
jgi:hypothetical protein